MEIVKEVLNYEIFSLGDYVIKVSKLVTIALIIVATFFILWLIKKAISAKRFSKVDAGTSYAIYQIIKYIIWIISITVMLETIGIKITLLLAGSAALLVGVGLGLQQTFNDIISGIILLSERSIKVGDVLEVDGDVVRIQSIGLRTSKALNRDDISIILPNSMITTNKVINWSHQSKRTRFRIEVGVAYGSDVDLVIRILEECALDYPDIIKTEKVEARLENFGSSSLDFHLLFFSKNIFRIPKVKADIRKIICKKFAENNIVIAFPQLDVHIKQELSVKKK